MAALAVAQQQAVQVEQAVLHLPHITLTAAETVETADRAAAFGAAAVAVLAAIQETAEQVEPMVLTALMGQEVLAQVEADQAQTVAAV